jgi:carbamate kinase
MKWRSTGDYITVTEGPHSSRVYRMWPVSGGDAALSDYLVIAFGGNAITPSGQRGTLEEQRANVRHMSEQLGRLILDGNRVVVTHGNGPQVGEIMLRSDIARDVVPPLSLDVAGAMSQGQIGYMLQQEIGNILSSRVGRGDICSLVTQVVVSAEDPAFATATKPIGRFYTASEAASLQEERGWSMVEDAGRGYRRVVPSPQPKSIVEWPAVKALADAGVLVIAAGGGGVPVIETPDGLRGVEAVIDKDLAAARLAQLVAAHTLVLLTEVHAVAIDFATPRQRPLGVVSLDEIKGHYADGQFPPGSMGPKVRSAIEFLETGGRRVIITSAENLVRSVVDTMVGTQIMGIPAAANFKAALAERGR